MTQQTSVSNGKKLQGKLSEEKDVLFSNGNSEIWNNTKIDRGRILDHIAKDLMTEYDFRAMIDNDELFYYNDIEKIWIPEGEILIREILEGQIPQSSNHAKTEVVLKIRNRNYQDRKEFDPTYLIGFENCALDTNTWKIISHKKENLLTKIIPVEYKPSIFPYSFEKFFDKVVKQEDRNCLLEMMAHCLMSDYRFQKAFVILGGGDNGKTTFLNVLIALLGEKNISSHTLQNFSTNQFAASKLFGKMANIADDISKKGLKETQTFKILTGNGFGDHNIKGKESITFRNTAKLIFSCNELPPIYEDTHAIWRRLCIINFEKVIPLEDQIKDLDKKLTTEEELSGILNILLVSLKRLIDRGSFEGLVSVLDTRKQYIKNSDIIHAFCDNCLEYEDYNWISTDELFKEMCLYAEAINQEPRGKRSLSDRIMMYKPKIYKANGFEDNKKVRGYKGLRIVDWRKEIEK